MRAVVFGLANPHDYCRETLRILLGITGMQGDILQVELAAQIDRGHDVRRSVEKQ